eukprot:jgi/Chrzof1/6193/Cz17g15020.t1
MQMNRTIQNYQKAYRKKVEGLKAELGNVRSDNQQLKTQVKKLRRSKLVSAPSLLVGGALGFLIGKYASRLLRRLQRRAPSDNQGPATASNQGTPAVASTGAASMQVAPPVVG